MIKKLIKIGEGRSKKKGDHMSRRRQNMGLLVKNLIIAFIAVLGLTIIVDLIVLIGASGTMSAMRETYIKNTDEIILTKSDQKMADSWERLPENEKRERLRDQYTEIVTYYTANLDSKYKMSSDQVSSSFAQLYTCLKSVPRINFFMPIAYIKATSNFNPVYNRDFKFGLASMYIKTGEAVSNLPIVKEDKSFYTIWKGMLTLNRPEEAMKLLVARIDDLMLTFNNREEWVFLSLFTNEYDVISQYWQGGEGKIPDEIYKEGELAETLKYYHSFKNWQIPARDSN